MNIKEDNGGVWANGRLPGFSFRAWRWTRVFEKTGHYAMELCYNVHRLKRYAIISVGGVLC